MAKIICIEAHDKAGKETQSKLLERKLIDDGFDVARVEVPVFGGITHRIIYWMLKNGLARRMPNLFQTFQFLNKFIFQTFKLGWLLKKNDYIIFDRWKLSGIIYGNADGVNRRYNAWLASFLIDPDVTVVLVGRSFHREGSDAYEADNAFQAKVKDDYMQWTIEHHGDKVVGVPCGGTREGVHEDIVVNLEEMEIL